MSFKFKEIFKRTPFVGAARVEDESAASWSAIDHMTPRSLASAINAFNGGDIAPLSLLWKEARKRDDVIPGVEKKRIGAVARKDWEIIPLVKGKEADRQKEAVEYFFDNLVHTDVMDSDKVGGVSGLMRSMMTAVGFGWSVHEIIWKPSVHGLTAEMRSVPLWFFERKKGRLRYLQTAYANEGINLEEGSWMVTAAELPLAVASLILYLFKVSPRQDWAVYCRRYVIPGLHGKTPSKKNSDGWNSLKSALQNFDKNFNMVTGTDVVVDTIDAAARGDLPFDGLIDRCDRRLSALWRGGDLSTNSSKDATGASLQQSETEILTADDAQMTEEVFNLKLIPMVLKYNFGDGVRQLVNARLPAASSDQETDLAVDQFFVDNGIAQGKGDFYERYGRSRPEEGEDAVGEMPVKKESGVRSQDSGVRGQESGVKEKKELAHAGEFIHATLQSTTGVNEMIFAALDKDLAPLRDRIAVALQLPDKEMLEALHSLAEDAPAVYRLIDDLGFTTEALIHAQVDAMEEGFKAKGEVDA